MHSFPGVDAVTDRLKQAIEGIDDWEVARQRLLDTLSDIRNEILNGTFPPK